METYIYDVETLRGPDEVEGGWANPEGMGFGSAVVYSYATDRYLLYGPEEKDAVIAILEGQRVVSFNGVRFDNRVLLGNEYTAEASMRAWVDIDLLVWAVKAKFGCASMEQAEAQYGSWMVHDGSIGLDGLAQGTLGLGKCGEGAMAPQLLRENRWNEVYGYNLHDVRLTRKLYEYLERTGYLRDREGQILTLRNLALRRPEVEAA